MIILTKNVISHEKSFTFHHFGNVYYVMTSSFPHMHSDFCIILGELSRTCHPGTCPGTCHPPFRTLKEWRVAVYVRVSFNITRKENATTVCRCQASCQSMKKLYLIHCETYGLASRLQEGIFSVISIVLEAIAWRPFQGYKYQFNL